MADIGTLPKLVGQSWSVKKTPTFQTRIQRAASGRELRALDYPYPLWQFELTWEALGDGSAAIGSLLTTDLRTLMGFFLACQGAFATFLYDDPTDDSATGQWLGVVPVSPPVTQVQLYRSFGAGVVAGQPPPATAFFEPIVAPNAVSTVYFNGAAQSPSAYSVDPASGIITFHSAIPHGTIVSADFSYYFRCRFMSDSYQFENFMFRLWSAKKLDFISVRP